MKITKQQLKKIIKEELAIVMAEAETTQLRQGTYRDKLTNIVNAWGAYQHAQPGTPGAKEPLSKLIGILKSFNVPKAIAIKIIKAVKQDEVVQLVQSGEAPGAAPSTGASEAPATAGDPCGDAKAALAAAKKSVGPSKLANLRAAAANIKKYCK